MIQFIPLEQRTNYDAIMALYYYMLAMSMPFYPEDIFPGEFFYEDGDLRKNTHPVESFLSVTNKRPMQRTIQYKTLLRRYHIIEHPNLSMKQRMKNDALLAQRIIRKASEHASVGQSLYHYLYEDPPYYQGHVNRERLQCLLTSYMDADSLCLAKLKFDGVNKDDLLQVFRYEKFASMPESVRLLDLLNSPVCPYCNRNFITAVPDEEGTRQGQFDHYLNKSEYPWFALSLKNLIPACGYCNQNKGRRKELVLYPYKEGMDKHYRFRTRPIHGVNYITGSPLASDEFKVVGEEMLNSASHGYEERLHASLKYFHLNELYQSHNEYILWIFRQRYIFPDAYLAHICKTFNGLFSSVQEAREMLYMRHLSPECWSEHPLSKLTHDIDEEISELENQFGDADW